MFCVGLSALSGFLGTLKAASFRLLTAAPQLGRRFFLGSELASTMHHRNLPSPDARACEARPALEANVMSPGPPVLL